MPVEARADTVRRFNPFDPRFSEDPYPIYRALRESAPVVGIPLHKGHDWVLTGYSEIEGVLADQLFAVDALPERIAALAGRSGAGESVSLLCRTLSLWYFFINGREHAEARRLTARLFAKSALEQFVPRLDGIVASLFRPALDHGRIDVVAEFAHRLPAAAISLLLGIEGVTAERLGDLSADLFDIFTQPLPLRRYQAIEQTLRELYRIVDGLFERAAGGGGGELVRDLHCLWTDGAVTREALYAICTMILSVGQDTTRHLIGNAVQALLAHPDQLDLLRGEAGLISKSVRELARYNTPVQAILRIAGEPCRIGGRDIRAGERVHLYLGAANRDPAFFQNPDRLDFRRHEVSSLPFGGGPHFCLGFHLAQIQVESALRCIVPHLDDFGVAEPRLKWIRSTYMRGLESLVIVRGGHRTAAHYS